MQTRTRQSLILLLLTLITLLMSVILCCGKTLGATVGVKDIDVDICYQDNVWHYSNTDNAYQLQRWQQVKRGMYMESGVKRTIIDNLIANGYDKAVAYNYCLDGLQQCLQDINSVVAQDKVDSKVIFLPNTASKFAYQQGVNGISVDVDRLVQLLIDSSCATNNTVVLPVKIDKVLTQQQMKANTVKRATFCTSYGNKVNRVTNIRRASQLISGTVVANGEKFSFNHVVGQRTADNGFVESTVIAQGKYEKGIGGGVCQVSTTLYNCALLAGLDIVKVYQHSLVPAYVQPSFDAMVADNSADLQFVNNSGNDIYIESIAGYDSITFNIYGVANPYHYKRVSQTLVRKPFATIDVVDMQKYPELVYTNQYRVITSGSDYVESIGLLQKYQGDKLISSVKIRHNIYNRVDRVVAHGYLPPQ